MYVMWFFNVYCGFLDFIYGGYRIIGICIVGLEGVLSGWMIFLFGMLKVFNVIFEYVFKLMDY